ncbi:MAG: hypothetical protein AAFQ82_17765, partial [Myxococcota bacterium]
ALTSLLLPALALWHVGGVSELMATLREVTDGGYLTLSGPRTPILGIGFAAGLLGIGLGYPGQPHVIKYFLAMDSHPNSVSRARTIALAWASVVYGGMLLLGLCGRAMFPNLADGEIVLIQVTEVVVHPIIAGIMLSAILSAIMSTADSQLLVAAGSVVHDLGLGKTRPLWAIRGTIGALSLSAMVFALEGNEDIFSAVLFGWAAMGAGFVPSLLIRVVLKRRLTAGATAATMILGSLGAVAAHLFYGASGGPSDLRNFFVHVVPITCALVLGLALSRDSDGNVSLDRFAQ